MRPRSGFTGRAAVLALVVCALIVLLAYPLRQYLSYRSQLANARSQVSAKQAQVAELKREQQRWKDPAYVKAQARQRLHYALPGETPYVVKEATPRPDVAVAGPGPSSTAQPTGPWFSSLWGSVQAADRVSGTSVPVPATAARSATGAPRPADGRNTR